MAWFIAASVLPRGKPGTPAQGVPFYRLVESSLPMFGIPKPSEGRLSDWVKWARRATRRQPLSRS